MSDTSTAPDTMYEVDQESGVFYVRLTLAHPMAEVYAQRARVKEIKDYKVGEDILVSREYGNALIDAGMIAVDPTDKVARQRALYLNRRNQPLTMKEIVAVELAEAKAAQAEVEAEIEARREIAARRAEAAAAAQAAADAHAEGQEKIQAELEGDDPDKVRADAEASVAAKLEGGPAKSKAKTPARAASAS